MSMTDGRRHITLLHRCVLVVALASIPAGCGIGGHSTAIPEGCGSSDSASSTYTITFPTTAGFSSFAVIANYNNGGCFDQSKYSAKASTSVIAGPPFTGDPFAPGLPDPTLKVWLYMSYQFAADESLDDLPYFSVTVPSGILAPGRAFGIADDSNDGRPFVWSVSDYAAVNRGSTTLTFGSVLGANSGAAITSGRLYQYALYSTGA
jgi:hypothetical protein